MTCILLIMFRFKKFDKLANNDFWAEPIDVINRGLEKNMKKDEKEQSGVSLVIGCPLPDDIQQAVMDLKDAVPTNVKWRDDLSALHITVYGLIMPNDYQGESSWKLVQQKQHELQEIFNKYKGFQLDLQGIGILGRGAVSIRISDSKELENMRSDIASVSGFSKKSFGSNTTKIVIGRMLPDITDDDRMQLKETCKHLQDHAIGTLTVDQLTLVHYKHTFLDTYFDKLSL